MDAISKAFSKRLEQGQKALIIYLMIGDKSPEWTLELVPSIAEAGADIIELGFPFSDPIADGPIIQSAALRAIKRFGSIDECLKLTAQLRDKSTVPLVVMTYYNLIRNYGQQNFVEKALEAGLNGSIIPDLPLCESDEWLSVTKSTRFSHVLLEAPTTSAENAHLIAQQASGFIYLVALKGVTGAKLQVTDELFARVKRLRQHTQIPLATGFGISSPEQAQQAAQVGDGIVIGSAMVNIIAQAQTLAEARQNSVAFVRSIRQAIDAPST